MKRVVFQLSSAMDRSGEPFVSISLEEPPVFGSPDYPFPCTGTEAEFEALRQSVLEADSVRAAGSKLFGAVTQHAELAARLQTALQTQDGSRCPVFVEIATSAGAETLPWEVLCSPTGSYLGLDERWSLARMVQPPLPPASFYTLQPPLRIAAVLSCLGVPADGELRALRKAVATTGGLATLLIIASEEALVDALAKEIAAGSAPEVSSVELMPNDLEELQTRVAAFGPHVLHLFCHGSTQGTAHVQLARKSDWEGNPSAGVIAEAQDFHGFTLRTDDVPWLVVLNCCDAAAASTDGQSQSLALGVALEGVAPAVVGMREAVVSNTANTLTGVLYRKLLEELKARVREPGEQPRVLDWAQLLVSARSRLARRNREGLPLSLAAASTKEWSMPVVYVRREDFLLRVTAPSREPTQAEADVGQQVGHAAAPTTASRVEGPARAGDTTAGAMPGPADATAARAARLEIRALQALLSTLPADQAPDLRAEVGTRIAELADQLGVVLPDEEPG